MSITARKWAHGLGAAVIGGGASAVTSSFSASAIAPQTFNLGNQVWSFLALAGVTFLVNGLMSAAFYLKQSPLPPEPEEVVEAAKGANA